MVSGFLLWPGMGCHVNQMESKEERMVEAVIEPASVLAGLANQTIDF